MAFFFARRLSSSDASLRRWTQHRDLRRTLVFALGSLACTAEAPPPTASGAVAELPTPTPDPPSSDPPSSETPTPETSTPSPFDRVPPASKPADESGRSDPTVDPLEEPAPERKGLVPTPAQWDAMRPHEVAEALIGQHTFGVQFIWSGYGSATISRRGEALFLEGDQRGPEGSVHIEGQLEVIDPRTLEVRGRVDVDLPDCCGATSAEGNLRFLRSGKRKYWRLQNPHREALCGKYTCYYYIDLFAG